IRQLEQGAEVLTDVASRFAVGQYHAKPDTARNDGDFQGLDVYAPHFSVQLQAPPLGNDEQFAVGIAKELIRHRAVRRIDVDSATAHLGGGAVASHGS